ncbi:MAG: TauD/TfdA family dioxygenase [Acidimicrobiia bacterium]|nr:TauD/TfdA family dioxygenase [Acidimicrobiia bacterium]
MSTTASTITVTAHEGECGATVTGVRLGELDDATFAQVLDAWHAYGVLAFPGQHLDEDAQVAFSRRLGALENTNTRDPRHPTRRPTTLTLANVDRQGELVSDPEARLNRFLAGNQFWHSDSSFKRISAKASMLVALAVPPEGGETEYADMRLAYEALDDATRRSLTGLVGMHSAAYSQRQSMGENDPLRPEEERNVPPVPQPLVRLHEPSGRRSLFIGRHVMAIEGMDGADARALLDRLLEGACRSPRVYRHRWQVGDAVLWDNRCILHRGRPWDFAHARVMRRSTIAGDAPPGDVNEWAL